MVEDRYGDDWDGVGYLKTEDLYGKKIEVDFHSAEADEENESYFYILIDSEEETFLEVEFTKEEGLKLLKEMAKSLGAKGMKIEIQFE